MSLVQAPDRTAMPQSGSVLGYDIVHRVTPSLGYQAGVAAVGRTATSAARGYSYPGFTALSARLMAHARLAGVRGSGFHVHVELFLGGAAQLAQIELTRLYFFYPSVVGGARATFSFDGIPSALLVVNMPLRYDLRPDLAVAGGAGLGVAVQFPVLASAASRRVGSW
jgi:hypothetical protein